MKHNVKEEKKPEAQSVFSFHNIAKKCSEIVGSAKAFFVALVTVIFWLVTGPIFEYSDTWQLVMNTISSVITFLMVFLIQNSQNRDTTSIQIKLDELILVNKKAKNMLLDLDKLDDDQIKVLEDTYKKLCNKNQ